MKDLPRIDLGKGPLKPRFAKRCMRTIQRKTDRQIARIEYRYWLESQGDGSEWIRGKRCWHEPGKSPF